MQVGQFRVNNLCTFKGDASGVEPHLVSRNSLLGEQFLQRATEVALGCFTQKWTSGAEQTARRLPG